MNAKPTYDELLKEIDKLRQQLEEKKKLEKEAESGNRNQEYEAINEELRQTNEELSLAKEKAEKSELLYRRIIENSPMGMHFYKLENDSLIFTGANTAADRLLHTDNSQFIG